MKRISAAGFYALWILSLLTFGGGWVHPVLAQSGSDTPYFKTQSVTVTGGVTLNRSTINAPPTPPPGVDISKTRVSLPTPDAQMGINTLTVPALRWFFGCSATSGAMIAGYHDRNGFPNMYTGSANGGVMPLNNNYWPTWSDGYVNYYQCPLTASRKGLEGRTTRGSIDDYWVQYASASQDPYITNGWDEHAWGSAVGDYMKTSQSAYGNEDGSTIFYHYKSSSIPLTCSDMENENINHLDGTYGRKLFYEARGYTVTDCYTQLTDNAASGGFSFTQYKAEIDAGRPVMLQLEGHTVVGVGYNTIGNTVYIHDTWDNSSHIMTWGGSYESMTLWGVSIVNLASTASPTVTTLAATDVTRSSATLNGTVNPNGISITYYFEWGTSTSYGNTTPGQSGSGSGDIDASAELTGLTSDRTYHYRLVATNDSKTVVGGDMTFETASFVKPTATTLPATEVTSRGATLNGTVNPNELATTYYFQWGSTTAYGNVTTTHSAGDGSSVLDVSDTITGLSADKTYHYRLAATNDAGTAYGQDRTWITPAVKGQPWMQLLLGN